MKLRINAGDKNTGNAQDKAIADAYRNKFIIPLDFEMLDSAAPYYQTDYVTSLLSMIKTELPNLQYHHQKFQMLSIRSQTSLEYEIVTEPDLARSIRSEYQHMAPVV